MAGYSKVEEEAEPNIGSKWRSISVRRSAHPPLEGETQDDPLPDAATNPALNRTRSSVSHRYRPTESISSSSSSSTGGLPGTLRRAFSTKKASSSVADAYWRIQDPCDRSRNSVDVVGRSGTGKKRGKVLQAWRRLLGIKP